MSVHSCSINLFKVNFRKKSLKIKKWTIKKIYLTYKLLYIVEVWGKLSWHKTWGENSICGGVYSWEWSPTECKVDQHHHHHPAHSVLGAHWWSLQAGAAASVGGDITLHTPVMVTREPRSSCSSVLPRHSAQTGHSVEAGAGLCWRSRRLLCCATPPPPPLLCAPPAQVNPGPGPVVTIRWTDGHCFLVNVWTLYSMLWPLDYNWLTQKKTFSVTQNINRFV